MVAENKNAIPFNGACADCGEPINDGGYRVHTLDGKTIALCKECFAANLNARAYERCDCCQEFFEYDCNDFTGDDTTGRRVMAEQFWVCNHCLEEYYRKCSRCGDYYFEDYIHQHDGDDGEEWICEDCWSAHLDSISEK